MKVKVTLTFEMEFDSELGSSNCNIKFALPEHPELPISDTVKKLCIEESIELGQALLERNMFDTNTPPEPS